MGEVQVLDMSFLFKVKMLFGFVRMYIWPVENDLEGSRKAGEAEISGKLTSTWFSLY